MLAGSELDSGLNLPPPPTNLPGAGVPSATGQAWSRGVHLQGQQPEEALRGLSGSHLLGGGGGQPKGEREWPV